MFHFTKKRAVVAMAVVGSLALSVGAYAYFTSTGTGGGSATVGTSSTVTIQGSAAGPLYPGTEVLVPVIATNPGPGSKRVAKVHLVSVATGDAGCLETWFTMADVDVEQTIAAGLSSDPRNGVLKMENTATDQGACQNAALTLTFSSN